MGKREKKREKKISKGKNYDKILYASEKKKYIFPQSVRCLGTLGKKYYHFEKSDFWGTKIYP